MGIETESRVIDPHRSKHQNDGTYLQRTKGTDAPRDIPPYGTATGIRRALPEPLEKDAGTLVRKDWLAEGLFPEMDELRTEHHRLIDELWAEAKKVRALHEQYDAEDEAQQGAALAGEEAPEMTSTAERADALKDAEARHWAAIVRLAEFCARAIEVIRGKWGRLPEFPDEPGVKLPEWRQEFAQEIADADKIVEEARAIMHQAERDVADIEGREMWLDRTSGQKANAGRYPAAPADGTRPTRAELQARRVPEFLREGVAG